MRITCTWYTAQGAEIETRNYPTVQEAYRALVHFKRWAHVYPEGSTEGLYIWRPAADNTLRALETRLKNPQAA